MRLFDENLTEIFLYSHVKGDFDSYHKEIFYSYKKISYDDINLAEEEYKEKENQRIKDLTECEIKSGLKKVRSELSTKVRSSKDEWEAIMAKYSEMKSKVPERIDYIDFMKEKFDLKEIDIDIEL